MYPATMAKIARMKEKTATKKKRIQINVSNGERYSAMKETKSLDIPMHARRNR